MLQKEVRDLGEDVFLEATGVAVIAEAPGDAGEDEDSAGDERDGEVQVI